MHKNAKIWIIAATALVLVGGLIFTGAMMIFNWDFTKLSTVKYVTNSHEITEEFKNISIDTNTANVVVLPSNDGTNRVICYEQTKQKHLVTVEDGTLHIKVNDQRKWYNYIGFDFGNPKITVYLADKDYGALLVNGNTGNVELPKGFTFENVEISISTGDVNCLSNSLNNIKIKVSTGDITLRGINCSGEISIRSSTGDVNCLSSSLNNITIKVSTGDITLRGINCSGKISTRSSTGDVRFERSDAAEIFVKTDTGDVTGTFLSDKIVFATSSTGKIDVPKSTVGGKCEISTDTGDIRISIVAAPQNQ